MRWLFDVAVVLGAWSRDHMRAGSRNVCEREAIWNQYLEGSLCEKQTDGQTGTQTYRQTGKLYIGRHTGR